MRCSITCKICKKAFPVNITADLVGKSSSVVCPHCQTRINLKVSQQQYDRLVGSSSQRSSDETFVPGMSKTPAANKPRPAGPVPTIQSSGKDSTYVPGMESTETPQKKMHIVIVSNTATETPLQEFPITQEYNMVGRKNQAGAEWRPDIEIQTGDMNMSKKHCLIRDNGYGKYVLEDHKSTNGTRLNGTKLKENDALYLSEGDVITIGRTELRVTYK